MLFYAHSLDVLYRPKHFCSLIIQANETHRATNNAAPLWGAA